MKKTIHYCQHTHDTMQQSLTDKLSASDDLILHLRTMYYQQLQETKTLMATQRSLNTRLREMTLEQTCGLLSTPHRDKQPQHRKHQHPKPQEDMDQRRRALETLEQRQHKADRREYELQWNRVNDQVIQHFQHMHVSTMDHGHGEGVLPCTLDSNVEKDEKETLRMTVDWVQQQLDRETERCLRLVFQKRYYQRENRHLVHSEQKIAQLLHSLHWVTPVPIHRSPLFKWRACVSAIIAIHRLR
ncbi:hypothetical protein BDF14DRAFT_1779086 [Spinellus fusiger]|nr:hypothetical protein BDF14DRAFT_1779086 [Spinellus fusiger]